MAYNHGDSYHAVKVCKLILRPEDKKGDEMLSFGCTSCRFEEDCKLIKHKQDQCMVANAFSKILKTGCKGHVNSFYCDTFYMNTNPRRTRIILNIMLKTLKEQYSK